MEDGRKKFSSSSQIVVRSRHWGRGNVNQITLHVDVTVIGSVDSSRPDARKRLDNLETDFQNRLMTMNFHGGMNDRDDRRRESRI